jgi:hypothetical protein
MNRHDAGVLALLSSLLLLAVEGCSSPSSPAASPDAQAVCPATGAETAGAACTVEGLVCSPQYACGVTFGIAHCVCSSGKFACTDLTDAALTGPASIPACPSAAHAQRCPATESAANLAACTEQGLDCSYRAPCGGTADLDHCLCFEGPLPNGPMGLRFECTTPCYPDAGGPPIDAGDSGQDATPAPVDAAALADASDGPSSHDAADARSE